MAMTYLWILTKWRLSMILRDVCLGSEPVRVGSGRYTGIPETCFLTVTSPNQSEF
jgi:hypothetical protein